MKEIMSRSSEEARTPAVEESEIGMTIPTPLVCQHAEESQGERRGTRMRRTQKARLAALEAEIHELRALKAQMAQRDPNFLMNATAQPNMSQREVPTLHESTVAEEGEEPTPPKSWLVLGDLRHSFWARKGGQRHN